MFFEGTDGERSHLRPRKKEEGAGGWNDFICSACAADLDAERAAVPVAVRPVTRGDVTQ